MLPFERYWARGDIYGVSVDVLDQVRECNPLVGEPSTVGWGPLGLVCDDFISAVIQ